MSHLLHSFPLISLHELMPITDAYQWMHMTILNRLCLAFFTNGISFFNQKDFETSFMTKQEGRAECYCTLCEKRKSNGTEQLQTYETNFTWLKLEGGH